MGALLSGPCEALVSDSRRKSLEEIRREIAAERQEARRLSLRWVALKPWERRRLQYLLATDRKKQAVAECLTKRPILQLSKSAR